jgi:hypothetical protein
MAREKVSRTFCLGGNNELEGVIRDAVQPCNLASLLCVMT